MDRHLPEINTTHGLLLTGSDYPTFQVDLSRAAAERYGQTEAARARTSTRALRRLRWTPRPRNRWDAVALPPTP